MDTVGKILRVERLRQGLSLEQITEQTRICQAFLQAIEADCFDRLPRGLLARSFIRQYARTLNLDEEQAIASFKEHFQEPALPMPVSLELPQRSVWRTYAWLLVAVVLCGAGYSLWKNVWRSVPEKTPAHIHNVQTHSGLQALAKDRVQSSLNLSKSGQSLAAGRIGLIQVVFSAKEPVWISVESDGKRVFTGTLSEQEIKEFSASGRMIAQIGNAGGLDVLLNGKSVGLLGQHGQVRLLELTPDHSRLISPIREGG